MARSPSSRGFWPGAEHPAQDSAQDSGASLAVFIVLLAIAYVLPIRFRWKPPTNAVLEEELVQKLFLYFLIFVAATLRLIHVRSKVSEYPGTTATATLPIEGPPPLQFELRPVTAVDLRCAWCHATEDTAQACPSCGTHLHPECAEQAVECPTLGCSERLAPAVDPPHPA